MILFKKYQIFSGNKVYSVDILHRSNDYIQHRNFCKERRKSFKRDKLYIKRKKFL